MLDSTLFDHNTHAFSYGARESGKLDLGSSEEPIVFNGSPD